MSARPGGGKVIVIAFSSEVGARKRSNPLGLASYFSFTNSKIPMLIALSEMEYLYVVGGSSRRS